MNKEILLEEIEYVYKKREALKKLVLSKKYSQVIILGNGGSNSIASHISQDYTKQLKIKAFGFSDPSRLTCYINDYGMEMAYWHFLNDFGWGDTLVILISSSGNSKNILNAATWCDTTGTDWVSLTGFDNTNELHTMAYHSVYNKLDLWVDSSDYGIVENVHQIFLHSILGDE
jgi:D-sedoheptulose 7-phosphate isomerase